MKGAFIVAASAVILGSFYLSPWTDPKHSIPHREKPLPENYFLNKEGVGIFTQKWIPKEPTDKIIVLSHGYGEHSGRYAWHARRLNEEGFSVYALDHQGFGKSEGERAHVEDFHNFIEDLKQFIEIVKKETKVDKVHLLGHSLGGLIAAGVAEELQESLWSLYLSAPAMETDPELADPLSVAIGSVLSQLLPKAVVLKVLDAKVISRDPKVVQDYAEDPLVYHARMSISILDWQQRVMAKAKTITIPIIIAMGTEDKLATPRGARHFYEAVGSTDKTMKEYEGYYHEILNEPEKEQVIQDLVQWLNAHQSNNSQ